MGDIFLSLLNRSITAGWLILAVSGIRLLIRRMPKWAVCLLWGVAAIRLIFPFSIESAFSLQPSAEPIRTSTIVEGELIPYVPSIDSSIGVVEDTVNPLLAETFAYPETESAAPLQIAAEIAGYVWLCGMAALLIFALASMIKLRLCVREAVPYRENIYLCDAVKSPFILGIVRPRIYLSSSLSEKEIAYIIAHESAHLKRKDHLWKPFGYLLLCIYWFNPLCWAAYMMLCRDIELACDEKVIRDMSFKDKKEYSRVLLSCAAQRRLVTMCPVAFGEVGVKDRVKSVLNYKKPSFWIVLLSVAACAAVAVCFLTEPKRDFSTAVENQTEDENMENEKDDNGYIWLSDTMFMYELTDLDGNGTKEYVEVDLGDESDNFYSRFRLYWNDEMIYEYEDPCSIDPCTAEYIDLDRDGEKELFFQSKSKFHAAGGIYRIKAG